MPALLLGGRMTTTLENLHLSMGISPNIERLFKKTNGSHDYNHIAPCKNKLPENPKSKMDSGRDS